MAGTDSLQEARDAYASRAWASAYATFRAVDETSPLTAGDLEEYARAAYLVGEDDQTAALLTRAFEQRERARCADAAGEDAFWLGFYLLNRGEFARAGGWLGRANAATSDHGAECPVRAKLLAISSLRMLMGGDPAGALPGFAQAQEVGRHRGDADLMAMAGLGIGQSKIASGEVSAGLAKLDEVMIAVTGGDVSPELSGIVYCAVIVACHQSYQPRRAAEWTRALSRWCDDQPELALFRGDCLVHRAQILVLNGAWQDATSEVDLACQRLADPPGQPAIGAAVYERAELHRMRGEVAAAGAAYDRAGELGHEVQPGLALLRLSQGRADAAWAGLSRALVESANAWERPRLLAAAVEIAIVCDDVGAARTSADELAAIADGRDSELLAAMAAHASGATLLAEGDPRGALSELRSALQLWRSLDAPYQCARARVLRGRCCERLGDGDAAQIEFRSAAEAFRHLGARPDLADVEGLGDGSYVPDSGSLTPREVQVIRAVSTGMTNRAIAAELFVSEKTIARHLSNIFTKLGISSRAAATAYAYEHDLV